jgi:hypothetical protein
LGHDAFQGANQRDFKRLPHKVGHKISAEKTRELSANRVCDLEPDL